MYWIKNISSLQIDQQYTDIVELFKSQINQESTILLALSGGVDSTMLFHLLLWYLHTGVIKKEQIIVAHMNHKTREQCEEEEKSISQYCNALWITCIQSSYLWIKQTETTWRKARINFFESIISIYWSWCVFMTGHHLDDRIETSIMNSERGAGLRWRLNMSLQKKKLIRAKWRSILQYVHMRPLLWWSKKSILDFAKEHRIKYLEDNSNHDSGYTRRNDIRKNLLLWAKNESIQERIELYKKHESDPTLHIQITPLHSPRKNITEYYRVWDITSTEWVQFLLDYLWIYQSISSGLLYELTVFFSNNSWHKYFQGRYFFRSHGESYCIKSKEKFWEDKTQPLLPFDGKITWKIRRNKAWDTRKKKRYKKFLINQKIPVFLRNQMPVVEYEGIVVGTLWRKDLLEMGVL